MQPCTTRNKKKKRGGEHAKKESDHNAPGRIQNSSNYYKFTIESAEYSLIYMKDKAEESTGVCNIKEHDIEALISPQKRGTYTLDIRYAVLDEILIEHIEVKVV